MDPAPAGPVVLVPVLSVVSPDDALAASPVLSDT
jgi:hypothetical protein